jgi:predicted pyridoxine 5'-phosphate oxidase superfamily flavin-nucleotide-binding protein
MKSTFHKGELAVQEKAGVASMASRIGGSIKNATHPVAQNFLRDLPFIVAASSDANGNVWASAIYGEPGFIEVPDEHSVRVNATYADEQVVSNIAETGRVGLLGIEFDTRLRMRLNGIARIVGNVIEIEAEEVFSNCQKYIQARTKTAAFTPKGERLKVEQEVLSERDQRLVEAADTFFIASFQRERGADASHRGGLPGFVKVRDERTIDFPDYSGNNMFQTLGNIEENGKAGLLFIDFETGTTLQMTGRAEILWNEADYADLPGANRAVRFSVEKVIETEGAFPKGWRFVGYSPSNP